MPIVSPATENSGYSTGDLVTIVKCNFIPSLSVVLLIVLSDKSTWWKVKYGEVINDHNLTKI